MIEKIYFDMDEVLADFDGGVTKLCGLKPLMQGKQRPQEDDNLMWGKIRGVPNYYDRLEPMPGAVELFRELYERYGDKCEILMGIPKPKREITTAGEDKLDWVHRLLTPELNVNIVYCEEKKNFCTGKDIILIDDLKSNIDDWVNYGGTRILHISSEDARLQLLEKNLL